MYEREIVEILLQAGTRGLPVRKIARHVYNDVNSLFEQVSYEEVYRVVRNVVVGRSRAKNPLFKHTRRRGYYRVNVRSARYKDLLLDGSED